MFKFNEKVFLGFGLSAVSLLIVVGIIILAASSDLFVQRRSEYRSSNQISPFTSVEMLGKVHAIIEQGDTYSISLPHNNRGSVGINYQVLDSRLYIRSETSIWDHFMGQTQLERLSITITTPQINEIKVFSSGSVYASDLTGSELTLEVSGSGNIEVNNIKKDKIRTSVLGSGTILVSGNCEDSVNELSGSGSIQAQNLRSETATAHLNGSGEVYVNSTKSLQAKIDGTGTVWVLGNPEITSETTGLGQIKNI